MGKKPTYEELEEKILLLEQNKITYSNNDNIIQNNTSRYHRIFDRSGNASFIIQNGRFIDCNNSAIEMLGYKEKSQIINAKPSDISPEFQPDGTKSKVKSLEMIELSSKNDNHKFEWTHLKSDGSEIPTEIILTMIYDSEGNELFYTIMRDLSDQLLAQQSIKDSEMKFYSLIQQSPFVLELYDETGLQIDVNKAYEEMWGFSAEITVGKFNLFDSQEVVNTGLLEYIKRAYEGEEVLVPEYVFDSRGTTEANGIGRQRWLSTKIYPLKNNGGKVTNIVITHEDISERKESMDALLFSEERFRSLVESTTDFIWEIDAQYRYTYVSPQIESILGYIPEKLIGTSLFDLIKESETDSVLNSLKSLLKNEEAISSYVNLSLHKDGSKIVLETNGVPFYNEKKEFKGYRGIDRDITERKQYEEQLILTESVFKNSIEGIAITDETGKIQKINKAFTKITGFSEEEALGQNPRILKSEKHDLQFYTQMWDQLLQKGQWRGEIWNRRKDGTAYPEWLSISVIRNEFNLITNFISVFHDISEKKISEEKLQFLAFHDPLTKLPNRRLFYDRLNVSIELSKRSNKMSALLYMDIDNFKDINDSHGHPFGDELLCVVKDKISSICRKSDTFARYGGDEFVIILNEISSSQKALDFSNKLVSLFKEPVVVLAEEIYTSLSVGLAVYPQDGEDIVTLEKNADMALYKAKNNGKRQSSLFEHNLVEKMEKKNIIINGLRKAVKDFSSFSIRYQPKVDIEKNRIHGLEALLRWQLDGEYISPEDFIPLAEISNLIIPIGRWVMEQAITDIQLIYDSGFTDLTLAINLSTRQFQDEKLFEIIDTTINKRKFDKSKLIFEITESTSIQDVSHTEKIMNQFRSRGINLSIDDFGTGYSSLSYLKKFPFKELKIDRSFVRDLPNDANDAAICKTIINIAKSLNYQVVAEGVETREQLDFLKENGCFIIQGYYFYKPMFIEEFKDILKSQAQINC